MATTISATNNFFILSPEIECHVGHGYTCVLLIFKTDMQASALIQLAKNANQDAEVCRNQHASQRNGCMDLPDECRQMGRRRPPQINAETAQRRLCSGGRSCRRQERRLTRLVVTQGGGPGKAGGGKYERESRYGLIAKIDMHLDIIDQRIGRTAIVGDAALHQ
ncbi:hypothetical protein [Collimonas sp.]|jgi:hypothetical protein|uniref:hypothetical protein n=1 Tax=Collimonas sp. TaxID=1963772 RepID=UPI0037BED077